MGLGKIRVAADDVEDGGQRGGGKVRRNPPIEPGLDDGRRISKPRISGEENVEYDVDVEQDSHDPYLSIRRSAIQRRTV